MWAVRLTWCVMNLRQEGAAGWTFGNFTRLAGGHTPPQVQGGGQVDGVGGRINVLHKDGDGNREAALVFGCKDTAKAWLDMVTLLTSLVGFYGWRQVLAARWRKFRQMQLDGLPALRKSGSCTALAFFLGCNLRKLSISSSAAVALSSGFGVKQFMMKAFASPDIHSGTLGWILNMPTLVG